MTQTQPDMADLELAERFLAPAAGLVLDALEDGACPCRLAVLLQCLALATARFDPAAEDDFEELLEHAMREATIDLLSASLSSGEEPS